MSFYLISTLSIAVLVFIDQFIKIWAVNYLEPISSMPFIPHFMELRFVLNTGMAFSLFSGEQTFLIVSTSIAMLFVAYLLFFKTKGQILKSEKLRQWAFILILAGGIGNLIDRVATGAVVDYLNFLFIDFAIFNFADICVCVGAGLFIIYTLFFDADHESEKLK